MRKLKYGSSFERCLESDEASRRATCEGIDLRRSPAVIPPAFEQDSLFTFLGPGQLCAKFGTEYA